MKVIFLDIDGVLNTHYDIERYGCDYIDSGLTDILKTIVASTDSKLVLSSTWRLDIKDRSVVEYSLKYKRLELFDCTPYLRNQPRAEEIKLWLNKNSRVKKYAIVDDDSDAGLGLKENFFQIDYNYGLTNEIAERVIQHLCD